MDKLQALINTLDAQFAILNIEGFQSEHTVSRCTEEEVEFETIKCSECNGVGEVYRTDLEWYNDEFDYWDSYEDFIDCPECGGYGEVEIERVKAVEYTESWTESNIII